MPEGPKTEPDFTCNNLVFVAVVAVIFFSIIGLLFATFAGKISGGVAGGGIFVLLGVILDSVIPEDSPVTGPDEK